jgi:hypothetical protein
MLKKKSQDKEDGEGFREEATEAAADTEGQRSGRKTPGPGGWAGDCTMSIDNFFFFCNTGD